MRSRVVKDLFHDINPDMILKPRASTTFVGTYGIILVTVKYGDLSAVLLVQV